MPPIKCHFDGKVIIPDEPVDLPNGQAAQIQQAAPSVEFTGGPGATLRDLLEFEPLGGPLGIFDPNLDSQTIAEELRRESSTPNSIKQHSLVDLHEVWKERRLEHYRSADGGES